MQQYLLDKKNIGCPATHLFQLAYNVFRNTIVSKIHDDISLTVNATLTDHYKIMI